MKNRRHEVILELITEQPVATQELLIKLLAERGIKTTQATLSRDIQQLSLVKQRDEGKAVLLVSLELDEVMSLPDRILVMYEGEIVGEFDPKKTTIQELGLYMTGAHRQEKKGVTEG